MHHGELERSGLIMKFMASRPGAWNPDALILSNVTLLFEESTSINAGARGLDLQSLLCGSFKLPTLNCCVESGQVVVLKGGGSTGKTTLLRLIAKHFTPTQGFVYVPGNWRVRFLGQNLAFFGPSFGEMQQRTMRGNGRTSKVSPVEAPLLSGTDAKGRGTLEQNLRFGAFVHHSDEEIWALLNRLGVSESLIGSSPLEFSEGPGAKKLQRVGFNGDRLSSTDSTLLGISRALLSSVDCLLLANTLDGLELDVARNVLSVLVELVVWRGTPVLQVELNLVPLYLRKKKLVIFSTKVEELEELADGWLFLGENSEEL